MAAGTQQFTEQPQLPNQSPDRPPADHLISIDIYLSLALSIGATGVSALAIKKATNAIKALSNRGKIDLLPARETRRVQDLLAQAAVLTRADRVTLGVFHNGHLSSRGYHMDYLMVAYQFERPAMPLLPEFNRDIPVSDILRELEGLWQSPTKQVLFAKEDLAETDLDCLSYLDRRGLEAVRFHLLTNANTEIGIVSYQYADWECDAWDSVDTVTLRKIEIELTDLCRRSSLQKTAWGNSVRSRR